MEEIIGNSKMLDIKEEEVIKEEPFFYAEEVKIEKIENVEEKEMKIKVEPKIEDGQEGYAFNTFPTNLLFNENKPALCTLKNFNTKSIMDVDAYKEYKMDSTEEKEYIMDVDLKTENFDYEEANVKNEVQMGIECDELVNLANDDNTFSSFKNNFFNNKNSSNSAFDGRKNNFFNSPKDSNNHLNTNACEKMENDFEYCKMELNDADNVSSKCDSQFNYEAFNSESDFSELSDNVSSKCDSQFNYEAFNSESDFSELSDNVSSKCDSQFNYEAFNSESDFSELSDNVSSKCDSQFNYEAFNSESDFSELSDNVSSKCDSQFNYEAFNSESDFSELSDNVSSKCDSQFNYEAFNSESDFSELSDNVSSKCDSQFNYEAFNSESDFSELSDNVSSKCDSQFNYEAFNSESDFSELSDNVSSKCDSQFNYEAFNSESDFSELSDNVSSKCDSQFNYEAFNSESDFSELSDNVSSKCDSQFNYEAFNSESDFSELSDNVSSKCDSQFNYEAFNSESDFSELSDNVSSKCDSQFNYEAFNSESDFSELSVDSVGNPDYSPQLNYISSSETEGSWSKIKLFTGKKIEHKVKHPSSLNSIGSTGLENKLVQNVATIKESELVNQKCKQTNGNDCKAKTQNDAFTMLISTLKDTYNDKLNLSKHIFSSSGESMESDSVKVNQECYMKKLTIPVALQRVYDTRNACLFCGKSYAKMARHYTGQHEDESSVRALTNLPIKSEKRKLYLELLRLAGNFKHNLQNLSNNSGEIFVAKRPSYTSKHPLVLEFVPCIFCLGFFHRKQAANHVRNCRVKNDNTQSDYVRRGYKLLYLAIGHNTDIFYTEILSKMKNDHIKQLIQNDTLICAYGRTQLTKKGSAQRHAISNKMRELARLVCEMNRISKLEETLEFYMKSQYHDIAMKAALNLTYNGKAKDCSKPLTLGVVRICHSLTEVCEIAKCDAIDKKNLEMKKDLKDFHFLMTKKWSYERVKKIPDFLETEDLVKLSKFIRNMVKVKIEELKICKAKLTWQELAKTVLSSVILLNKRREGDADLTLLENYLNKPDWKSLNSKEILNSLSPLERALADIFYMIQIRGEKNLKVPILFTPLDKEALDLLCSTREEVGISTTNPYLYANTLESNISGSDALNFCVSKCKLNKPHKIQSIPLRNYICTASQVVNLSATELEFLSNHMGHSLENQKMNRLHESTIETTKVAKLLLAVDQGVTHKFAGQSIQDVALKDILFPVIVENIIQGKKLEEKQNGAHANSENDNENISNERLNFEFEMQGPRNGEGLQNQSPGAVNESENLSHPSEGEINVNYKSKNSYRRNWDTNIKFKAKLFFANDIINKKAPGKLACEQFLKENSIQGRTWKDIKALIYNNFK